MMMAMNPVDATLFLKAMLVGLSIAAPVGPIGLLTIQRTMQRGMPAGLATGLGAATADAVYGAVGAWGVTNVVAALTSARVPLSVGGSALLLWLAWQTWRAPLSDQAAQGAGSEVSLWAQFAGMFALTLSNPATILSFVAIFASLSATFSGAVSPLVLVGGVFLGSALWWLLLATGVARLRHSFTPAWRVRISRLSAGFLAVFALWQWVSLA
jgi:threonine/homoserine/homoserine lactone efflux protein